jgi:serine/threonine protein kinase
MAAILNAFCTDDHVVLISELLEGESLKSMLERGPLPLPQALDIMSQVLLALSYAHARGVIHGDISPANIFVTASSGTVKLIDFSRRMDLPVPSTICRRNKSVACRRLTHEPISITAERSSTK